MLPWFAVECVEKSLFHDIICIIVLRVKTHFLVVYFGPLSPSNFLFYIIFDFVGCENNYSVVYLGLFQQFFFSRYIVG
jgi:hypothetical protein